jgi:transposase
VTATGARFGINALSAISKNGVMKFMSYEWSFTADTLILFLEKLIHQADPTQSPQKYTLILDGHPTHKTKKVQDWLASHTITDLSLEDPAQRIQAQIRLYHIPPYSPELNPDEQVWWNVKQQMKWVISISSKDIRRKIHNCLLRIQKKKALIRAFFQHPEFI